MNQILSPIFIDYDSSLCILLNLELHCVKGTFKYLLIRILTVNI